MKDKGSEPVRAKRPTQPTFDYLLDGIKEEEIKIRLAFNQIVSSLKGLGYVQSSTLDKAIALAERKRLTVISQEGDDDVHIINPLATPTRPSSLFALLRPCCCINKGSSAFEQSPLDDALCTILNTYPDGVYNSKPESFNAPKQFLRQHGFVHLKTEMGSNQALALAKDKRGLVLRESSVEGKFAVTCPDGRKYLLDEFLSQHSTPKWTNTEEMVSDLSKWAEGGLPVVKTDGSLVQPIQPVPDDETPSCRI